MNRFSSTLGFWLGVVAWVAPVVGTAPEVQPASTADDDAEHQDVEVMLYYLL